MAVIDSSGARGRDRRKCERGRLICLFAVSVIVVTSGAGLAADAWNVGETSRVGQWTIYNRSARGSAVGLPLALGDVDGDRRADAILTPMYADSGPAKGRIRAGEVAVVLSSGTIAGEIDLAQIQVDEVPGNISIVYGADPQDLFGTEVATGDLNRDGYDDIVVGAQFGDGHDNDRPDCGDVTIIWGGPNFGGNVIDLRNPPNDVSVTSIYGRDEGDRLGVWVSTGDFDGDGFADAYLGADQGDGPDGTRTHAGEVFVLYGGAQLRQQKSIDLATTTFAHTIVYGIDPEDHAGATVRSGDLNGDGVSELLIGAGLNRLSASQDPNGGSRGHGTAGGDGPDNAAGRTNCGEAYILYGARGSRPQAIDLTAPPASAVVIHGVDAGDAYGEEMFAGDFNGDGHGDVAIGALSARGFGNALTSAGEVALVYGGPSLPGSRIDLADFPANVVFFYGAARSAIAGDTAMLVDLDGDQRDDLVIASPNQAVGTLNRAGVTDVIFGTSAVLPQHIELANLPPELSALAIEGGSAEDILAYSMYLGDVDADGLSDLLLNLMGGDGFDDLLPQAGDAVVLSGFEVSRAAGRVPVVGTPTPTPTPGPCVGDCDENGVVTVDEVVYGLGVALGNAPLGDCPSLDADGLGHVTINELVVAVGATLFGCR